MVSITVAVRHFTDYKYLLRLALVTILQFSFLSCLGFNFLVLHLQSMEDKRDTKRTRSPFKEGSLSPDGAKTPPSAPSGSPSPLTSPPKVSSCRPHSSMLEQGDPPGRLQRWIFLRLLMREISSLMSYGMRCSPQGFWRPQPRRHRTAR
jgi:hypothetical protein